MPREYNKKVGGRPYQRYTPAQLQIAIDDVKHGKKSINKSADDNHIPRSTLQRKLLHRQMKHPGGQLFVETEIEKALCESILTCSKWGYPLDLIDIRCFVKFYFDKKGQKSRFKDNLPGYEWAKLFLKRHKELITERMIQNIKRSRAKVTNKTISEYFYNLKSEIEGVPPSNLINYDETNLADTAGQKKCIVKRGCKYPERVMDTSKASTSIMFAAAADGTPLPPYIVYKAKNMYDTWTYGGPEGARYNRSASGWFDSTCFSDWFEKIAFPYLKKKDGKKVLIGDNLSSHLTYDVVKKCEENNINFIFLPANSTHITQPLDVAYFRPMKIEWRKIIESWKMSERRNVSSIPKDEFPKLLKELVVKLSEKGPSNIQAGFRKCGIYPFAPNEVLKVLPDQIEEDGDDCMNDSLVIFLKEMRYPQKENQKSRKKKVNVTPGKSVSAQDIEHSDCEESATGTDEETTYYELNSDDDSYEEIEQLTSDSNTEEETSSTNDLTKVNSITETSLPSSASVSGDNTNSNSIKVNDFILVNLKSMHKSGTAQKFIGKVLAIVNHEYEVSFLRNVSENIFSFPENEDTSVINLDSVLARYPPPDINRRGQMIFQLIVKE